MPMDEGDFAMEIAAILENTEFIQNHGWEVEGRDLGEIDITTDEGQRFRLSVGMIPDEPSEDPADPSA